MSAAVVHHPRTILPKFNFLLAGGAVVLSIIAITDNVGSNTATVTKPAAVTATVHKAGAGTARPEHASKVATATVAAVAPAVVPRLMDESRLATDIGTKVVAPLRRLHEQAEYITSTPAAGRALDYVGPAGKVVASTGAGSCGLKISTTC